MNWDGTQPAELSQGLDRLSPLEKFFLWWNQKEDPTIRFFHGLLLVHLVLWTLLPMLMHHNPSRETLHLLTMGRQWAWGYHQQAPLPAWLAITSCALTGTSIWPTYLLGSISGAVCIWCAWSLGRQFLKPWTAVCAAIAMEACFYFNYTVPVLSSETIGRAFWALAVLSFYWAVRSGRRTHWVQTAVCLGLGLLSRYDTALLLGAMLLFTFWNERARRCWDTSRPFMAAGVIFGIVFFHAWWVMDHIKGAEMTFTDYLRSSEQAPEATTHPLVAVLALLPVLLVLSPLVNWLNPTEEYVDEERELVRQYLVWVSFMPPAIMAALALVNGLRIDSLWMSPLWVFGGVLFVLWSRLDENRLAWRRTLVWTGAACGLIAGTTFATYALFPPALEDGLEVHFPGPDLAKLVNTAWVNSYPGYELKVVGGDWWMAGNAAWYDPQHPYVYANLDPHESPLMRDEKFQQTGGVIVLDASQEAPNLEERVKQISAYATELPTQALQWQHTAEGTKLINVRLVMVPPMEVAKQLQAARDLLNLGTPTDSTIPIQFNPLPAAQINTVPGTSTASGVQYNTYPAANAVVQDPALAPANYRAPLPVEPAQQFYAPQPRNSVGNTAPGMNANPAIIPAPAGYQPIQTGSATEAESDDVLPQFPFAPRN